MEKFNQCGLCICWEFIQDTGAWGKCMALSYTEDPKAISKETVIAKAYFKLLPLKHDNQSIQSIVVQTHRFFSCYLFQERKTD